MENKIDVLSDGLVSHDDYKPSESNPGMPAMFLKPKTILKAYDDKIKAEKSVNVGQFKFIKTIYSLISAVDRKAMNKLLRAITGENFVTAQKSDVSYIAFDKKNNVVGYCMISNYSPENHFKTEGPYLYNFITDTRIAKEKRCSHPLLAFVEKDLTECGETLVNIDVLHDNIRAFKFFISNNYRVIGKYEKLDLKNMNLYEVDNAINKYKLIDKIKEIKQRRGLSTDSEPVTINEATEPNKKIKYLSLTKKITEIMVVPK